MLRNRRRTVILVAVSLVGLMAFAFAYRVIAGQATGNRLPGSQTLSGY